MSERNGNRSRFHRLRKQKIARRERNEILLKPQVTSHVTGTASKNAKQKPAVA